MRYLDCRVDYSIKTFGAVVNLCKDLGIRHPEELSLCKPLEATHLKRNYSEFPKRKLPPSEQGKDYVAPVDSNTFIHNSNHFNGSNGSLDSPANPFSCAPVQHTPHRPVQSTPISSPMGVSSFVDLFMRSNRFVLISIRFSPHNVFNLVKFCGSLIFLFFRHGNRMVTMVLSMIRHQVLVI